MDSGTIDFASDNHAGVHPEVLAAVAAVNAGYVGSYGSDPHTDRAVALMREHFGADAEIYFVLNGTAANVLSAAAVCRGYHAVISADTSHFHHDEAGATERFAGCRVLAIAPDGAGKMTPESLAAIPEGHAYPHQSEPRLVSITQTTELGTVYSLEEIRKVAECVHGRGWLLHMDGARLANASAHLGTGLREMTGDVGVDVLSFGGTKNGIMMGEAVVFFDADMAEGFPYIRKQGLQLASKMRFISAQFEAMMTDDLWLRSARHANQMARLLAAEVEDIPDVQILQPVQGNAVFARVPPDRLAELREESFFHAWDEDKADVRWMASFNTSEDEVREFASMIHRVLQVD